jgi:hypothetical protein
VGGNPLNQKNVGIPNVRQLSTNVEILGSLKMPPKMPPTHYLGLGPKLVHHWQAQNRADVS